MGRVVRGASCPWGEMSVGRNVRGANCPWGEMSVGRDVRGAKCLWGEMSVGRNVRGARCHGASCRGASCLGASGPGTEKFLNEIKRNDAKICEVDLHSLGKRNHEKMKHTPRPVSSDPEMAAASLPDPARPSPCMYLAPFLHDFPP
jgi:hypothetical protein